MWNKKQSHQKSARSIKPQLLDSVKKTSNKSKNTAMKNLRTQLFYLLVACGASIAHGQQNIQLSMGPGYANDIFYSMNKGIVKTEPNTNWDLSLIHI